MAERYRPPYWATREKRVSEPGPQSKGAWHVLQCTPGQEAKAAEHLAGRGFGAYVPMCRAKVEGLMVIGACHPRPELAGYVLAYLWGDDWARARECPGITGILQRGNKMATMPDACVKLLRIAEAQTDEGLKRYLQGIDADAKRSGRRRRRRKSRRIGGTA